MKVVTSVFVIKAADPVYNAEKMIEICKQNQGDIFLFPAFALTGVSIGSISSVKGFDEKIEEGISRLCDFTEKNKTIIVTSTQKYGNMIIKDGDVCKSSSIVVEGKKVAVSKNGASGENADVVLIPTAMAGYPCIKNDIIEYCANASKVTSGFFAVANAGYGESSSDDVFKGFCGTFKSGVVTSFMAQDEPDVIVASADIEKTDGIIYSRPNRTDMFIPYYGKNKENLYLDELFLLQEQALYTKITGSGKNRIYIKMNGSYDCLLSLFVAMGVRQWINDMKIICIMENSIIKDPVFKKMIEDLSEKCGFEIDEISGDENGDIYGKELIGNSLALTLAEKNDGLLLNSENMTDYALGNMVFGANICNYNLNLNIPRILIDKILAVQLAGMKEDIRTIIMNADVQNSVYGIYENEDIKLDLIDFVIFYFSKFKFDKEEIKKYAFATFDDYTDEEIERTLNFFFERYNETQYIRSVMPEGANLLGFRLPYMPSDVRFEQ